MAWWNPKTWFKKEVWIEEEPPMAAPIPLPAPEVPKSTLIYTRERGTGVFVPILICSEGEVLPGLLLGAVVFRIALPMEAVGALLKDETCFRGFIDAEIESLRSGAFFDIDTAKLVNHLRDR